METHLEYRGMAGVNTGCPLCKSRGMSASFYQDMYGNPAVPQNVQQPNVGGSIAGMGNNVINQLNQSGLSKTAQWIQNTRASVGGVLGIVSDLFGAFLQGKMAWDTVNGAKVKVQGQELTIPPEVLMEIQNNKETIKAILQQNKESNKNMMMIMGAGLGAVMLLMLVMVMVTKK